MTAHLKKPRLAISRESSDGEKDDLVVLTLNEKGMIRSCNPACRQLLGTGSGTLVWRHVSTLLPQLANIPLKAQGRLNPKLQFLSRVGHCFEVAPPNGGHFLSRLFFNEVGLSGHPHLCVILRPIKH